MMRMSIYAVRDAVAGAFATPFVMRSDAEAIRAFTSEVNNPASMLGMHATDYALYELGWYEDDVGLIHNVGQEPRLLVTAVSVKKPSNVVSIKEAV
jgi:hypothetical protein